MCFIDHQIGMQMTIMIGTVQFHIVPRRVAVCDFYNAITLWSHRYNNIIIVIAMIIDPSPTLDSLLIPSPSRQPIDGIHDAYCVVHGTVPATASTINILFANTQWSQGKSSSEDVLPVIRPHNRFNQVKHTLKMCSTKLKGFLWAVCLSVWAHFRNPLARFLLLRPRASARTTMYHV